MATPALLQESPSGAPKQKRPPRPDRYWLHALLFVVTLLSTTVIGMRYADNFSHGLFPLASDADIFPYEWAIHHWKLFATGLPFSCTLLGILLVHEFGHYFACKFYGIRATLPFLLPAPSLSGTAGAVIRLKSRIKSRAALLAIGAFGPISGFVIALITTCIGLAKSTPIAAEPVRLVTLNQPLLIRLLERTLNGHFGLHLNGPLLWHPVFVASWVGILITSLNLIPAGQLDGGHILYSISPRMHRVVTLIAFAALLICGITQWLGWLVWAALLSLPGMRHPKVPMEDRLPRKLVLTAPIALLIFVLSASPAPFAHSSLPDIVQKLRSASHKVEARPTGAPVTPAH